MNHDITNTTIGKYLTLKRNEKKFTIEKLAQKTKINLNLLKALEQDDFKQLPSAAYLKGFVVTYSKTIGIDKDEAIKVLEETYFLKTGSKFPSLNHTDRFKPTQKNLKTTSSTDETRESSPQEIIENATPIDLTLKKYIPLFVTIGVVVVIGITFKVISDKITKEAKTPEPQLEQIIISTPAEESIAISSQSTSEASNVSIETTDPTLTTQPAIVKEETNQEVEEVIVETPIVEKKRRYPLIEFKPVPKSLFTIVNEPSATDIGYLSDNAKNAYNDSLQNISIRAVEGNTWISYKVDEQPIQSTIIEKGKELFIQGSEIRLFLGNVNVTRVFYNNNLITTPTRTGLKSLIFPQESSSKFQLPLFPKSSDDILYTSEEYQKRMKREDEALRANP